MRIVVFGLSISSAWGNGHATLLRGLFRALYATGHDIHFFERDMEYYAMHRDASSFPYVHLHLYTDWLQAVELANLLLAMARPLAVLFWILKEICVRCFTTWIHQ